MVGYSMLWHGQQLDPIPHNEISLVVSAPAVNQGVREELQLLGCEIHEHEAGIYRVAGHLDLMYYALQQVAQFRKSGEEFTMDHKDVKYMGEVEEELQMAVLESIPPERRMRGIPPEERLRGLPPEERLRGLPPEERLRGLPPEERLRGLGLTERLHGVSFEELVGDLSEEQRAQLRALLERQSGN